MVKARMRLAAHRILENDSREWRRLRQDNIALIHSERTGETRTPPSS
jgi:hypothetical protein